MDLSEFKSIYCIIEVAVLVRRPVLPVVAVAVAAVAEEEDCESLLPRRARPARVQHHSSHTSAECSRQILCMRLVYPGVLGERETVVCGPKFVPSEAPIVP